jgi:isopenicillin N synthase-like dioxygenase
MTSAGHLPLLDIGPLTSGAVDTTAELTVAVDRCLREDGFLVVVGHGVPDALRAAARRAALDFFHQDDSAKRRVRVTDRRGWVPTGHEATGYASGEESLPDLKESFTIGNEPDGTGAAYRANRWDTGIAGFRDVMTAYVGEMLRLGHDLMRLFALTLGIAEDHLTSRARHPDCELNLNWYPPIEHVGPTAGGQFRIGPHSDYGCCTILDREPGSSGLQIRTRTAEWIDAPLHPGSYTVNIGDLLERMTGGRWRSTPHRVLPPSAAAPSEEHLSLVFFHEFDADALIETLPPPVGGGECHEPVVADDYISAKYTAVTL